MRLVCWPTRAIQKYKLQYNNIYFRQQYVFQYKKIHSSTQICFSVHKYVFQYNNIYSRTDSIPVQNYRNICSTTEIYVPVQKYIPRPGLRLNNISQTYLRSYACLVMAAFSVLPSTYHLPRLTLLFAGGVIFVY